MRLGYGILFASSLPGSSRNPRNLPFRDHRLGNLCLPQFPFATDGVSMAKDPFSGRLPGSGREDDGEQPGGCGPWPADWWDGGGEALDALVAEADAGRCEVPFGGEDAGDLGPEAFAPGGLAEGMGPGPVLAGLVHAAAGADGAGLDALSGDQLRGVGAAGGDGRGRGAAPGGPGCRGRRGRRPGSACSTRARPGTWWPRQRGTRGPGGA